VAIKVGAVVVVVVVAAAVRAKIHGQALEKVKLKGVEEEDIKGQEALSGYL